MEKKSEKMFMHYFNYHLFSYIFSRMIALYQCLYDAEFHQEDDGILRFS